ncbi:MAG TPA: CoA protein activase [Firmicutes bacterium]|nr:CoA protein activase [Bacillota bacterium]
MRVTFPRMGALDLTFNTLFKQLGAEVVPPPPATKATLALGVKHAPEFACLPLKLMLGNFIQAVELGADTIVMCGGCGPCRLGHYAQVQQQILEDLGYRARIVVLEASVCDLLPKIRHLAPHKSWREILRAINIAWVKMNASDGIESLMLKIRPRAVKPRAVTEIYEQGLQLLAAAHTVEEIRTAHRETFAAVKALPLRAEKPLLRIGIVGELFVALEPLVNQEIERRLGELQVEVKRTLYVSEWVRSHLLWSRQARKQRRAVKDAAQPYLGHWVGGHGLESIGRTIQLAQAGFDGVIQVLPFTCMPEIVAKSILPQISKDYGMPVMTLVLDEHAGEAGIMTRIEAFVDLLERRRKQEDVRYERIFGS